MQETQSLFLSQLILNHRSRDVRRDLGNCHELHRTILKAFPQAEGEQAREKFGVLFRVDADRRNEEVSLMVQSNVEPDWRYLPVDRNDEPYCAQTASDEPNPACKPMIGIYDSLRTGQQLIFRLRANPTKRISARNTSQDAHWHGKRVELYREEDRIAWLVRKAGDAGFRLLSVRLKDDLPSAQVAQDGKTFGWRNASRREQPDLAFGAVLFEGELEIIDADKFKQALANGIGSGKAYGFGLLSIAPAR
jgi:CRISPR system Cascade subunit CasE